MKFEEEITCPFCSSEYFIIYEEAAVEGKIIVCPFCGTDLPDDGEDDIENGEINNIE